MEDLANVPDGIITPSISQQNSRRKSARHKFEFFPWPDLHQYAELVGIYNSRLLTYQSDALLAFSAIIETLSRSFQGGFLYGSLSSTFDISMLWRPNIPTQLRVGDDGSPEFPSWSWVGWQGNVVFSCTAWSNLSDAFVPKCLSFCLMDHSGSWAGMICPIWRSFGRA
jgi:hypothetical protein